jgi:ribosomal protein S3AE
MWSYGSAVSHRGVWLEKMSFVLRQFLRKTAHHLLNLTKKAQNILDRGLDLRVANIWNDITNDLVFAMKLKVNGKPGSKTLGNKTPMWMVRSYKRSLKNRVNQWWSGNKTLRTPR